MQATERKTRLLLIGLDSADRHLIEQWSADGSLPVFGRLLSGSLRGDTRNPTGMVAGTVWPSFYTGVLPGRTGRFRGTTQFVTGSYEHADIDFGRRRFPPFWDVLAKAGLRCTVIDAPYAFLSEQPNVTQLVDWCAHSPWQDGVSFSNPPALARRVRQDYGRDPVGKCDFARLDTAADFRRFTDGLIQRIETKLRLTLDLLNAGDTDLLFNVFSECHCAGHQLWHLHDAQHPLHDAGILTELGADPLREVYRAMDRALGRLLDAAGEIPVLVFCSHGIGPAYSGTHLLDEILLKLEGRPSPRRRQGLAQAMVAAWTGLPQALRTALTPLQKKLWPKLKAGLVQPGKAQRRFFEIIVNDAAGGVRINLKGREPAGKVEPGAEYDEVCDWLERELRAVVNPGTGKPLVARVLRSRQLYPGQHSHWLPDLLVVWDRSGPIHEAESPSIGRLSRRFVFRNHRTGDHTEDDGLFFFVSPATSPARLDEVSVADLPPTIAALLGVDMPGTDGRPVSAMLREPARNGGLAEVS